MAAPKVEQIPVPIILGEGPHWDHKTQTLYYVDIAGHAVNKYIPATRKHSAVKIEGGQVSFVIPLEGAKDTFVITVGRNVALMKWDGESSTPSEVKIVSTVDSEEGKQNNILNDGKADPTGRLWSGTLCRCPGKKSGFIPEAGTLYSFDKNWKPTAHATNITLSNGMAWNEGLRKMYYIDSVTKHVDVYDFNADNGIISNKQVAFDFVKNGVEGIPDGMTIDTEGKLWVACVHGSQVIRVDPITGKLITKIHIPSEHTTSLTFGGPHLDELYVTSANLHFTEEEFKRNPNAGATFRVTGIGAKGYPAQNVRV